MYFWRTESLKRDIVDGPFTDKEFMPHVVLTVGVHVLELEACVMGAIAACVLYTAASCLPNTAAAGEAVGPPAVRFTDITSSAGIDFVHTNGAYGERLMPETMGSGAVFFDADRDGDPDLFLVDSRHWQDRHDAIAKPHHAYYRNDGSGSFEEASAAVGLDLTDYGMGAAAADYDGDGWVDLYVTNLGSNRLLRNVEGRFVDVTEAAGVGGGDVWSASAAFFDYDRDGDLDLFVVNYIKWSRAVDLEIDFKLAGLGRAYGAPVNFVGTNSRLYRNEGDGRFSDVSAAAGIEVFDPVSGHPVGKGLGIAVLDYDRDGWLDVVVVNDTVRNFLFHNLGDGRFEEVGVFEGLAYDRNGKATSAMGVDAARFRDDADLGIAVGNFANEMASLFTTANGRTPFADEAVLVGLGPASRIPLTFGVLFFDYDLDGRLDLLLANGHLEHEINKVQQSQTYAQPPSLFWHCGPDCPRTFIAVTEAGELLRPLVGRGVTAADIDGDGDPDLLITQNGRRPALLRNDQASANHWLRVELVGHAPNTDAIGARLELTAGGLTRYRTVSPSRGYLSQVEHAITFGLGPSTAVERLVVHWPDGSEQTIVPDGVDRAIVIEQAQR